MRIAALVFGLSAISAPLVAQQALPASPATPLVPVAASQLNGDVSPSNTTAATSAFVPTSVPASVTAPANASDASTTSTTVIAPASTGPTAGAARAGVAPRESKELTVNKAQDRHVGAGQNVALMVVGGAALITGLIVGGDGGTLLAVGGAVVGLFGLYGFVK